MQDIIKRQFAVDSDGMPLIDSRKVVFEAQKDPYWDECPAANRLP
ncbi:MAG: hypothetical protein AB7G15_07625 [Alphaproteobacteria bacterium]